LAHNQLLNITTKLIFGYFFGEKNAKKAKFCSALKSALNQAFKGKKLPNGTTPGSFFSKQLAVAVGSS
jgi:hypothetical protein